MTKNLKKLKASGFTLIEILVVIGLIAVLAAVVIIAINPARQFAQGRNSQRVSNVNSLLNAIGQNMADNKGVFTCGGVGLPVVNPVPNPLVAGTGKKVSTGGGAGDIDLACLTPIYIPALPFDPNAVGAHWTSATDYDTGYNVFVDSNGRTTVFAPTVELTPSPSPIQVTR